MKKKLLSLFTALGMLLSMAAVLPAGILGMIQASASMLYGPCGDNAEYCYDTETKTLTINGTGDMTNCVLDDEHPWNGVENVIIEEGITSVGNYAFYNEKKLNHVELPSSIKCIGTYAFAQSRLAYINLNDGLEIISECAFQGCPYCLFDGIVEIPSSVTNIASQAFGLGNFEDAQKNYPTYFRVETLSASRLNSYYGSIKFAVTVNSSTNTRLISMMSNLPSVKYKITGNPNINNYSFGFSGIKLETSQWSISFKRDDMFGSGSKDVSVLGYYNPLIAYYNSYYSSDVDSSYTALNLNDFYNTPFGNYYTIYCDEGTTAATLHNAETIDYNLSHYTTSLKDVKYTGEKVVPDITLTHGTWTLKEGRDYTVDCPEAVNAGKVDVTITGIGKYTGSLARSFYITKMPLNECEFSYNPAEFTYNGKNQIPTITLKNPSGVALKEDEDYILEITGNKDVGKGTFTITGCGNYTGSITKEFNVNAKAITKDNLEITLSTDTDPAIYTGNAITPNIISVKDKDTGLLLVNGTDYTATYLNNTNAGTASIRFEGIGNYTSEVTKTFNIGKVSIKETEINITPDSFYYDGTAKKPTVQVSWNNQLLTLGTDYSLSFENNTDIGTGVVTVTGKGNFDGFETTTFSILGKPKIDIATCSIFLDQYSYTYDGTAHTPSVSVYNGLTLLKENVDYEVKYSKNTNAGTASVIISGIGEYTGSNTEEFTINPRSIKNASADLTPSTVYYDGNPKQPSVKVTDGDTVLVDDVDYSVSYSSNTDIGTGVVTVEGKGNYYSSFEVYFDIAEKDHIYENSIVQPTCTAKGYTIHTCKLCGYTYSDSYVNALGHDYKATVVAPTCTSRGYTHHKCTRCNDEYNDTETEMTAHSFGDWITTTAPTCTAKGVETRKCKNCEATETREVKSLGHDYVASIIPPTCTSKGYTNHKCTRCNDEYNDTETQMTAHSFGDWRVTTAPTCAAQGVETRKCKNCEATETRDVDVLDHKWSDWKTTAFDVNKGTSTQTRTCSACNKTESKTTKNALQRLAGSGRYETAAKISQAAFDQAETVVLAYGLNYADALAGVSLATKMNAPILLTNTKSLDKTTLAEIKRLKAKNVIILGGTGAISTAVENSLKKEGLTTDRIFGASRFGTATAIAEKLTDAPTDVFFVYAFNSADALSVSPIAACKNAPIIYLSTKGDLNADTAAYLAKLKKAGCVKNAYVIGGEGVISDDMATKAAKALGLSKATRIAGANRFSTCVAVNEKFADVLDGDMLCVATGMDFPDALAGGVYAAINKAPLFLINGKTKTPKLTDEQKAYLKTKAAAKITAFGGVGVVPDNHIADIAKNSI